jgi:hypothetical protein
MITPKVKESPILPPLFPELPRPSCRPSEPSAYDQAHYALDALKVAHDHAARDYADLCQIWKYAYDLWNIIKDAVEPGSPEYKYALARLECVSLEADSTHSLQVGLSLVMEGLTNRLARYTSPHDGPLTHQPQAHNLKYETLRRLLASGAASR